MAAQSYASSSSSWIGVFARSVSGSLSAASRVPSELGLELTQLADGDQDSNCVKSGTQPVNIPGLGAAAAAPDAPALVLASKVCVAGHIPAGGAQASPSAPSGRAVTSEAIASAATEESAADVPSGLRTPPLQPQISVPIAIEHPLREQAEQLARFSSSGGSLPSALGIPSFTTGHPDKQQQQQQQQQRPQDDEPSPSAPPNQHGSERAAVQSLQEKQSPQQQQKVRWVPGLLFGKQQQQQQQQLAAGPDTASGSASTSSAAGAAGASGSSNMASTTATQRETGLTGDASGAAAAPAPKGGSAGGRLPPSGNAQLDKYLRYLLMEAHPHRFMYYPNWGLTEDGCAAVGEFLRRDRRVKVATLSGNDIRDEGVELIAEALTVNSSLTCLDLSENKISNMGAIALAEALHNNKTLTELQIRHNRIGDEGAEALAAAVASSSALKKLHLSGNPISAAQQQVVQHVLKTRVYKMPSKQPSSGNLKAHMRKNSSLQFHIELTDNDEARQSVARLQLPPALAIAALCEPNDTLEESVTIQADRLMSELENASPEQAAGPSRDSSSAAAAADIVPLLALRLAARGYDVVLRTSCHVVDNGEQHLAAAAGPDGSVVGLKHTFVCVVQPGMETSPPVVVDPLFRSQFEIPHMTDRYRSVLDTLPPVLCLSESRLYHLVEVLCNEMATAFKESGLSCPPWRDVSTVLDKWLAKKPIDVAVDADASLQTLKVALAAGK